MSCLMNSVAQENGKYIEHEVSKFDTLAGVAIKYGVEVSDIKRMNGLATHLQMFAFKRLLIPLPARHAPSSILSHSSSTYNYNYKREISIDKRPPPYRPHSNGLQQSQSLRLTSPKMVSPAMTILHKYYSLKCPTNKTEAVGTEMAVRRTASSDDLDNPLLLSKGSPDRDLKLLPSTRNDIQPDTAVEARNEKSNETSVRRRQKADGDSSIVALSSSSRRNGFSHVTGKGLAMRPKSSTPTSLTIDTPGIQSLNSIAVMVGGLGDDIVTNGVTTTIVHKSPSTPTLQGQDNCGSPSVWSPSKWNLTPELLAAAVMTGRKSKAALD